MTPVLEAHGLALTGRLQPTDLRLAGGTLTALIGPNGSGKTSLLRAIAGVESAGGSVQVGGEALASAGPVQRRQLLGFLPAGREMVWPIAARDVIALGLERPDSERIKQVIAALELGALAERPADRLSTGERARVLMGRVLAQRPAALVLDEPLSNLDPYWALRMSAILREAAGAGAAVLVALHDLALLREFDRVLMMSDGRIVLDAQPDIVLADDRFEQVFRVRASGPRWQVSPAEGRRSSP